MIYEGEFKKRIENLKEAHEKLAEICPTAENCILRNKVVEALDEVKEWIDEMVREFPRPIKIENIYENEIQFVKQKITYDSEEINSWLKRWLKR